MKPFLMYKNQEFTLERELPKNEQELTQDLELNTLFDAMSKGDEFLLKVVRKSILTGLQNDIETILYRQNILKDVLKNISIINKIYEITIEAIELRKGSWLEISKYPSAILYEAKKMMDLYLNVLEKLRDIANEHSEKFESEGFKKFFEMIKKELNDEYFIELKNHLKQLEFSEGILCSAELGKGNVSVNYKLSKLKSEKKNWLNRTLEKIHLWIEELLDKKKSEYTFYLSERDESGARMLAELNDRIINSAANVLAQSTNHIKNFFEILRIELSFYLGCANLYSELLQLKAPVCFPIPLDTKERKHSFKGLYDVCLVLTKKEKIVGNDIDIDNKNMVIITGANQGGKSTFLRSIGLSQLMMQSGMFVSSESFSASICDSFFTHYKREEDTTMKSGKLDEELERMSTIIDNITPSSILLFNESFAATNEIEGSQIATQITRALMEKRIRVFFVTHLYEFARSLYERNKINILFLRAERNKDGTRSFKLFEGEPFETSYGKDLYDRIFIKTE